MAETTAETATTSTETVNQTGETPTLTAETADGKKEQPNTGQAQPARTLESAEERIKELNAENIKWRNQFKAAEKAKADAETAMLAEQGKFKELFEKAQPKIAEYDTLKERYDALIHQVEEANKKRIASIPESMKSLVPEYDDPQRLAAWLDANASVFAKPQAPSLDGRAGGNSGGSVAVTDEQVKAFAVRFGINPEYVDRAEVAKAYNVR